MKILLWDSFHDVADHIGQYLPVDKLVAVDNFPDFQCYIQSAPFECIIADITGNRSPVADLVQQIKAHQKPAGLIFISREHLLKEKIEALRAGADDFMGYPFELSELVARVVAVVRRTRAGHDSDLSYGDIRISIEGKLVFVHNREISLTRKELELLLYFIEHRNSVVRRESLVSFLSGNNMEAGGNADIIYAHIKNLKKKLVSAGCSPYLKTVYGVGYKWENS